MSVSKNHDYHLVELSPWPVVAAVVLFILALGAVMFMHHYAGGAWLMAVAFSGVLYTMYAWWRDVVHEARVDKAHTSLVQHGLRIGMALFILSEVMFFFVFFWSFFKAELSPVHALGADGWPTVLGTWPPAGIEPLEAGDIPLMNTLILLLSGCSVTWAHYSIMEGNQKDTIRGLFWTVVLGLLFTTFQVIEYVHAPFHFTDGIFASNFYMATGFHGFHVLVGTLFLLVCWFRARKGHFSKEAHLGFEFAAWYWHFVDVVWLFLFVFVYWLGS